MRKGPAFNKAPPGIKKSPFQIGTRIFLISGNQELCIVPGRRPKRKLRCRALQPSSPQVSAARVDGTQQKVFCLLFFRKVG